MHLHGAEDESSWSASLETCRGGWYQVPEWSQINFFGVLLLSLSLHTSGYWPRWSVQWISGVPGWAFSASWSDRTRNCWAAVADDGIDGGSQWKPEIQEPSNCHDGNSPDPGFKLCLWAHIFPGQKEQDRFQGDNGFWHLECTHGSQVRGSTSMPSDSLTWGAVADLQVCNKEGAVDYASVCT